MDLNLALASIRGFDRVGNSGAASGAAGPAAQTGPSFADALQNAAETTVGDLRNAEKLSMQALTGDADIREVTDAVMSAEQNLQAAIAIRDKIVTAFLEISRMQI
jgi:flagellar hook-basal body complex protein FliE